MNPKYSRYYVYIKPVIQNKLVRSSLPYIFSLIAMIVLLLFAIRPTISTVVELQKSIEDNKKVLATLTTKAQNLTEGKRNLDNMNPVIIQKINSSLPDKPNITILIASLNQASGSVASISALQIQPITLINNASLEQKNKTTIGEINFSYNIQGSYQNLLTTLYNLNKAGRLINIDSINLSKQTQGVTSLSINGKSYYLK